MNAVHISQVRANLEALHRRFGSVGVGISFGTGLDEDGNVTCTAEASFLGDLNGLDNEYRSRTLDSVQFNLEKEDADAVLSIPVDEKDFAAKGRDTEPHVTVLFGLLNADATQVSLFTKGIGDVDATLGDIVAFPAQQDFQPLVIKVISPQLKSLHYQLGINLPYQAKHSTYIPHICVAYLKPGEADKYVAAGNPLKGRKIVLKDLVLSKATKQMVPLERALRYNENHGPDGKFANSDESGFDSKDGKTYDTKNVFGKEVADGVALDDKFQEAISAGTEKIAIKDLIPTQNILQKELVDKIAEKYNPNSTKYIWPSVLKDGNKLYLMDGHHRVAAAMKAGKKSVNVNMFEAKETVPLERSLRADDSDGEWVTINGTHVFIGKGGTIEKGPKDFIGKTTEQLGKEPSQEVKDAIKAYTAQGGKLASQYPMTEAKREVLEKYVTTSKLDKPTEIYRGFWLKNEVALDEWFGSGNTQIGHENEEKGLKSFSKDSERVVAYGSGGHTFVNLSITATSGADISAHSVYKEEKEVLVSGMKWQVTSAHYDSGEWKIKGKEVD